MSKDQYSAGEQALGYTYQPRLALLKLLKLSEDTSVFIEKDDDLDFIDSHGVKTLGSLKHKKRGGKLTDASVDFWKSVNIWLTRYIDDGKAHSNLQFFLFTTDDVSSSSFLVKFALSGEREINNIVDNAEQVLGESKSQTLAPIKAKFDSLSTEEKKNFFSRLYIFDASPRIDDVPELIMDQHMRTIHTKYRESVFERLEGWWNDLVIKLLTGARTEAIYSREVSDKLASINEEYRFDNLPITFGNKHPTTSVDPENDDRLFVVQLKHLGISHNRIKSAIVDYYRAFEQRASWAREQVLLGGEIDDYEDKLTDEWGRMKDVVYDDLGDGAGESKMNQCGKALYKWAEMNTDHLKIRDRVSEAFVVRGSFHILANEKPRPKVYWHPLFLERLKTGINDQS